jgi:hypothetical protein
VRELHRAAAVYPVKLAKMDEWRREASATEIF